LDPLIEIGGILYSETAAVVVIRVAATGTQPTTDPANIAGDAWLRACYLAEKVRGSVIHSFEAYFATADRGRFR